MVLERDPVLLKLAVDLSLVSWVCVVQHSHQVPDRLYEIW
jgi:hypothetical protein